MAPTLREYLRGLLVFSLCQKGWAGVVHKQANLVRFRVPDVTADSLHNVHIEFLDPTFQGDIQLVYGECEISSSAEQHHGIGSIFVKRDAHPERFVWAIPPDAPHLYCLHAFSESGLLGRSSPVSVATSVIKRENIADVADMMGPWFDGIAYMQGKEPGKAVVAQAKDASVAIIGGGMSGLMTSLLLDSVGMHNWHIMESSGRIGGRIRTKYLNDTRPDQYQYQEMGPMRFPVSITYADTNETLEIQDHKMVFQLSDVLNSMNADHPELAVNFIPFIQKNPNVPAASGGNRLPNGRIPTAAELAANSSLAYKPASSNATAAADAAEAYENYTTASELSRKIAANLYQAHKSAIESGYFHWSEAGYLRYALGYGDDITDYVAGSSNAPMWDDLYEGVYFSATKWRTIDKGLESLPRAFWPHVANKTTLHRKIEGLSFNETSGKIAVNWRDEPLQLQPNSEEYDYAVVSAPFSKVRLWDLPRYSSLLSRAISTMNYAQSCKMSLHFKTRFWEHQEQPIFGGCGSVDLPGIGSVCYPSFNINGTGPGVVLASYITDTPARSVAALSTEDHVALVLRSMVQIHGPTAMEQYTGIYNRQCWEVDEHQAGAWAAPLVGQQDLYLPAYYQTEFKTIFIGEHTSYTHAWIFSALDSAVRGTTQLLLDLGLVDEAKSIVNTWMGRWIKV
ncbi:flavin-containing amine oxidoreductase-domain containing protein [Aspergillus coremiiformis]|uniref:Flavin-containing amine oxidoreductase-domain containing protein n=1 Tax=Aspergillus coremiiformis TaxID=138285 RepID=A0A5N6ZFS5_9EURO|nr:flavin-containing amine oxidoreductase-domain containing protein [Aspergillus coremiiformis]